MEISDEGRKRFLQKGVKTMEISKEDLKNMIVDAFNAGEQWGATYIGWFNPTPEQCEEEIQRVLDRFDLE